MLVGYNTNVSYKGTVYHVQTEDNGLKNPLIVTLLYVKGTILAAKRTSYAEIASSPDFRDKVREMMKEQHKDMIKDLIAGRVGSAPPGEAAAPPADAIPVVELSPADPGAAASPSPGPAAMAEPSAAASPESAAKGQIARSLDDILLDYIMKREE